MAVLSCYDRKVERSFMIEAINANAMLMHCLTKLEKAGTVRHMLDKMGHAETPKLDVTADYLIAEVRRYREQLADKVMALTECPNAGDMIS